MSYFPYQQSQSLIVMEAINAKKLQHDSADKRLTVILYGVVCISLTAQ